VTSYTVHAKRWEHGWELHIDGEGVTQTRSLANAERVVKDYIGSLHDVDTDDADVTIIPEIGADSTTAVATARAAVKDAAKATKRAAELSRSAVGKLRRSGLNGAEIATVLGVSPQRVSQLTGKTGSKRTHDEDIEELKEG
jgi:hypothetical protein